MPGMGHSGAAAIRSNCGMVAKNGLRVAALAMVAFSSLHALALVRAICGALPRAGYPRRMAACFLIFAARSVARGRKDVKFAAARM